MAVDSQRGNHHINIISPQEIGLLMSAQSYRPEVTQAVNKIKQFPVWKPLQEISLNTISPGPHPVYKETGYPCIKTKNVLDIIADQKQKDYADITGIKVLRTVQVNSGDLLINLTGAGSIGRVSIYFGKDKPITNQHIARITISNTVDAAYVCAFLRTWWGERAIEQGIAGSTGQLNMVNMHVRSIPIPIITDDAQKHIGNKVRQAETLRAWAKESQSEINRLMKNILRGSKKPLKRQFNRVDKNEINSERLEAEFYRPEMKWAEDEIRGSKFESKQLKDLAERIKDGPGGWGVSTNDYVSEGVPVIRSINIVDGVCDLRNSVFISMEKHRNLIAHRVKRGSVILSVRGSVGRAAVFDHDFYDEASINAAVVTIDCKKDLLPHYLAEFLNSEVGKVQSKRLANGAVQLNMNLNETGNNWIPVPNYEFQINIETLRKQHLFMKKVSSSLPEAAKFLVEALIENKLTEQELINAQQALERGSTTLDRQILSRLTTKGIDHEGSPPLFPNLDQLYELLEKAEEPLEVTP